MAVVVSDVLDALPLLLFLNRDLGWKPLDLDGVEVVTCFDMFSFSYEFMREECYLGVWLVCLLLVLLAVAALLLERAAVLEHDDAGVAQLAGPATSVMVIHSFYIPETEQRLPNTQNIEY